MSFAWLLARSLTRSLRVYVRSSLCHSLVVVLLFYQSNQHINDSWASQLR